MSWKKKQRRLWAIAAAGLLAAAGCSGPQGPASELIEGTLECDEVDVSAKVPGRLLEVLCAGGFLGRRQEADFERHPRFPFGLLWSPPSSSSPLGSPASRSRGSGS